METLNWKAVYYNGKETNVEVTKYGDVRRVKVDWAKRKTKFNVVDFSKLKTNSQGYRQLKIQINGLKNKNVSVHQLVAAAFLGYKWQGMLIVVDHIDSDKLNNSLNNLQLLTHRQNLSKERTEKSGLPTGVHFHKQRKKFVAQITIDGIQKHLGSFNTPTQASNAYQNALMRDKQHLRMVLFDLGMFSVPRQLNNNAKSTIY